MLLRDYKQTFLIVKIKMLRLKKDPKMNRKKKINSLKQACVFVNSWLAF